jgi:transposase InsO family protein
VIESLAGQGHSAKQLCQMLGVAPSGFFYWRSRAPTMLELRTEHLGGLIADIHHASRGTYGTRRVTAELRLGYDITANRKAVSRIMRSLGCMASPS